MNLWTILHPFKIEATFLYGKKALSCDYIIWRFMLNTFNADTEYENPLQNSEKIACVGQRLLYPIMGEKNTLPC